MAKDKKTLVRGNFLHALAHSKVFILKKNDKPVKVITGSTNFSTNGFYINANHLIIFNNTKVADLYEQVFEKSFGQPLMNDFKETDLAIKDFSFKGKDLPEMVIRFSPHSKAVADNFFTSISNSISNAKTDVLFAIMKDTSKSAILDAVMKQVKSNKVFTYGITDVIGEKKDILLYKPNSKRGIRIAGKPGTYILPKPWEAESKIPGISVHHKFVVVDFKGPNPVVYCGSSNLAFGPEQKNGDNLLAIYDRDIVTAFAIEAIRLVDHFHYRNTLALHDQKKKAGGKKDEPMYLYGSAEVDWVKPFYDKDDLKCLQRILLTSPDKK